MLGAKTPHTTMRDPPLVTSCRDSATPGVAALQACLRLHCPNPMGNKQKKKTSEEPGHTGPRAEGNQKGQNPGSPRTQADPSPNPVLTGKQNRGRPPETSELMRQDHIYTYICSIISLYI